jgi:hypothetical protein
MYWGPEEGYLLSLQLHDSVGMELEKVRPLKTKHHIEWEEEQLKKYENIST